MPTPGDFLKPYMVNNYILLDSVSTGSYVDVRLGEKTSDRLYAVKVINKQVAAELRAGRRCLWA